MYMSNRIGQTICTHRQLAGMTQEELADRLGVTPQAVSKWERGNGMPDLALAGDICKVLGIKANELLGVEEKVVENGSFADDAEIRSNLIAEPLLLECGVDLIPCIAQGLQTGYVNQKRLELAKASGKLIPLIRIRDNTQLAPKAYRVLSYDKVLLEGNCERVDETAYCQMVDAVFSCGNDNYDHLINKQIVKTLVDNLRENYPGIVDDLIPEKVSYLQIERKLQQIVREGGSIRNLIHIIEEMEEAASCL